MKTRSQQSGCTRQGGAHPSRVIASAHAQCVGVPTWGFGTEKVAALGACADLQRTSAALPPQPPLSSRSAVPLLQKLILGQLICVPSSTASAARPYSSAKMVRFCTCFGEGGKKGGAVIRASRPLSPTSRDARAGIEGAGSRKGAARGRLYQKSPEARHLAWLVSSRLGSAAARLRRSAVRHRRALVAHLQRGVVLSKVPGTSQRGRSQPSVLALDSGEGGGGDGGCRKGSFRTARLTDTPLSL
eukprot:352507-Chlamydomonas_euryale.AAC.19